MEYKLVLGIIAIIIGLYSYIPYFRDIFAKKTKPHAFSWFVWGVLTATAFVAQMQKGGGAGAWITGVTAVLCLSVAVIAFFRGEKNITKFDWGCLVAALLGIVLWLITNNPLTAVIIVTITDAIGFAPTFRKAYHKPYEETISTYFLSSLKFAIALFALESYSLTTWLYPASLVLANGVFAVMVLLRRKKYSKIT